MSCRCSKHSASCQHHSVSAQREKAISFAGLPDAIAYSGFRDYGNAAHVQRARGVGREKFRCRVIGVHLLSMAYCDVSPCGTALFWSLHAASCQGRRKIRPAGRSKTRPEGVLERRVWVEGRDGVLRKRPDSTRRWASSGRTERNPGVQRENGLGRHYRRNLFSPLRILGIDRHSRVLSPT